MKAKKAWAVVYARTGRIDQIDMTTWGSPTMKAFAIYTTKIAARYNKREFERIVPVLISPATPSPRRKKP